MHFHPDKCNLISITQKRKPIHFTYKLHHHPLAKVEHSKYLGITLQSNLKWNKHINSITNKANQSLGFLKMNLKIKSSDVKSHAYKALVRPKLEYASAVWDPHTRTQINQIEKVQRRAARYVTNRYHNTSSVTDMLQNLNWPSLEIRRTRVRLIIYIIREYTSIFAPQRIPFYKALGVAAYTVGKVLASTVFMCVCCTFRSSDFVLFVKNGFVVGARTLNVTAASAAPQLSHCHAWLDPATQ